MAEPSNALETELATYRKMLPEWSGEQGRFALIAGDKVLGIFDTYNDALTTGYAKRGLDPFLVKQIATIEVTANFTRSMRTSWHSSMQA